MKIHVPPELRAKPKRLPPKRNKRGGIGKSKKKILAHSLYASAAVVAAPSLPMEVTAPCNEKKIKRKDWKVDRALLSRDWKIRKLKEAVTSKKCDHVLSKLTLIAKINVGKKMLRWSQWLIP